MGVDRETGPAEHPATNRPWAARGASSLVSTGRRNQDGRRNADEAGHDRSRVRSRRNTGHARVPRCRRRWSAPRSAPRHRARRRRTTTRP